MARRKNTFSLLYQSPGLYGLGLASSSNLSILYAAAQLFLSKGKPSKRTLASVALASERVLIGGRSIAAQDIYPIVYGGVINTRTYPDKVDHAGQLEQGEILPKQISISNRWISNHVLLAYKTNAKPHKAPQILEGIFNSIHGRAFIAKVSSLASQASSALKGNDPEQLGVLVTEYSREFDQITKGQYSKPIRPILERLQRKHRNEIYGWKLPGAGNCSSLILVVSNKKALSNVSTTLEQSKWVSVPVAITHGVEFATTGAETTITAGHRIDFIGAGDLGQDIALGMEGNCCGAAISPRASLKILRS